MDRAEVMDGKIVLNVKEGVSLTLTLEDVYLILGVDKRRGTSTNLPAGNDQYSNVFNQLYKLLKYASKWVPNKNKKKDDQGVLRILRVGQIRLRVLRMW